MAKRYALVIGIEKYTHLGDLPNARTDAEAIAKLFEQHGHFESVTRYPSQYIEAENKAENRYEMKPATVSAENLWNKIDEFLEISRGQDAVVFIAAHGLTIATRTGKQKGYIAASKNEGETHETISFEDLNEKFVDSETTHSSLTILLDCCHSGLALEQAISRENLRAGFSGKNFAMLAACRGDQEAYEQGEHSVFATALLDACKQKNANQNDQITFYRLADSVKIQLQGSGQEADDMALGGSDIWLLRYPKPLLVPTFTESPVIKLEGKLRKLNYRNQDSIFAQFLEHELAVGAFWVRHEENGGQRWLLNRLWREQIPDATSAVKFYLKISKRWQLETVWNRLGSHYGVAENPEAIAEHLCELWNCQQTIALVLYGVERLSNADCQALIDQLWQPITQKIAGKSSDYPLLLFLVDTGITDNSCCSVNHVCNYDPNKPESLVDLPLDSLGNKILKNWVNTHAKDLLPECTPVSTALEKILACNQQPEVCVKEVLDTICQLCGYHWQDIESQFVL